MAFNGASNLARRHHRGELVPARAVELNEQIDNVVNELNGICRTSSLDFAQKVGAVIIYNFYGGDTVAWRERGPKLHSFRRLAEHPDLSISPGALYRCVAVFELCDRLRVPSRWRRLGASHLRAVIGVPHESQEALLAVANDQRWSVQVLLAKAQELKASRARGGRRPRCTLEKSLLSLDQRLRDCESLVERLCSNDPDALKRNLDLLTRIDAALENAAQSIRACRGRVTSAAAESERAAR